MGKVDELGRRLTSLDERTKAMEDVDKKIKNLTRPFARRSRLPSVWSDPKAICRSIAKR